MRSSIACARCRRSKVKCVNNGVGTVCRACENTGRECTYNTPIVGSAIPSSSARRESGVSASGGAELGALGDRETPRRRPPKKTIPPLTQQQQNSSKESLRAAVDALNPALLTPKIWTELFDIYTRHFSTDLPFFHTPSFIKPLRQASRTIPPPPPSDFSSPTTDRHNAAHSAMPPLPPILLLAFLALTSRFHPTLVAHHSPQSSTRPSNPLVAAEYYATAARAKLAGEAGDGLGVPTLERTQTLLMLALHEWGMCQGAKAWISLGVAVRSAQVLGLQYEQELDDEPLARNSALTGEALSSEAHKLGISPWKRKESKAVIGTGPHGGTKSESFIQQEVLRRTFWSCFVLDRYMSSGKYRPQMLHIKEIRIQLPSSEKAFHFGHKVRTLLIGEEERESETRAELQSKRYAVEQVRFRVNGAGPGINGMPGSATSSTFGERHREDEGRWEVGPNEGVVSRFIRLTELYGRMVRWSCRGGRRTEEYPPWDSRSTFDVLRTALASFIDHLPSDLTLTPDNMSAQFTTDTSTPYILMHTVFALCQIILHREYIPFIPLRCPSPQGPLDPPLFPAHQYQVPEGFWVESARCLFRSARELMDLLEMAEKWDVLVETPIVGFAIYTVAFTGVYASQFNWMDPDGFMCTRHAGTPDADPSGFKATRKAFEMIGKMRARLKMAEGWVRTVRRSYSYFATIKKDFKRNKALNASNNGSGSGSETDSNSATVRPLSLREGGSGGGLEEYKLLELTLKEFGSLEDEDLEMGDADGGYFGGRRNSRDENSESGSGGIKSEGMELQEGTPDSNAVRQERWNAINSVAAAANHQRDVLMSGMPPSNPGPPPPTEHQARYPSSQRNAPYPPPQQSPIGSAKMQGYHPLLHTTGSNGTTPLVSPGTTVSIAASSATTPYSTTIYPPPPPLPSLQSKPHPGQQQQSHLYNPSSTTDHHPSNQHTQPLHPSTHQPHLAPHQHQGYDNQMWEQWLDNIDTKLGGDDVAAFTDGTSWEQWGASAGAGGPAVGGWLGTVWGNGTSGGVGGG